MSRCLLCTHNPAHMPRLLPICIFISHLPNSCTLILPYKYTCIFQYILLPLLYESLVPSDLCCLLRVNSCMCVSTHVYAFPSCSIFIHTYRHLHMYGLCSVLYVSPSFRSLSSDSINLIDSYVTVPIDIRTTY